MTWFLPSYGRPEALRTLLSAPGGWPDEVVVLVNADDPQYHTYHWINSKLRFEGTGIVPWTITPLTAGARCADAHRFASENWPNAKFYGLLCDDHWPVTPGWHERLVEAAGDRYIATPAGEPNYPKIRNAVVLGGELVRAMGSLVPCLVKHNYEDNLWDQVAGDFDLLRPLPDVIVEHRHPIHGTAKVDDTYRRGSIDIEQDRLIFQAWLGSPERSEMNERIAKRLGGTVSSLDPSKVRLVIATPMQDNNVDIAYHSSLALTVAHLSRIGVNTTVIENTGGSHIGKARERLLWDVLNGNFEPTHILFVDADMGWEPQLVVRMLCADHEFSAAIGVKKVDEKHFCANFLSGAQVLHETTRFLKVAEVGFAFVMLKPSVIEKLCRAYPELEYEAGEDREHALFLDMIDNRTRLSEDFSFCRRWLKIGGEIWIDPNASLIHAGRKEYTGKVNELFKAA